MPILGAGSRIYSDDASGTSKLSVKGGVCAAPTAGDAEERASEPTGSSLQSVYLRGLSQGTAIRWGIARVR